MKQTTRHRTLIFSLILLMLSNSSLALEIVTHDAHGHSNVAASGDQAELMAAPGHGSHNHAHNNAHNHAHSMDDNTPDTTLPAMTDAQAAAVSHGEDCVCDDICCVSSVQFATASSMVAELLIHFEKPLAKNHYQSISLDLVLPPPTV